MLADLLRYAKDFEVFIYLLMGLFAVWQIRKLALGWREYRSAAFGLERESAQGKLNRAASMFILVFIFGVVEFALVSFVLPTVPSAYSLPTTTLDLLATPTTTLSPNGNLEIATTPLPTVETNDGGCMPGLVEIIFPADGQTIKDIVEINGTANIPNFGFYKFEMAAVNDSSWQTIQAGETITTEGRLGFWDTTRLNPGDYALRLVVTDNQGQAVEPCVVQIRVDPPTETE